MREAFKRDLLESRYVHRPLALHPEESREARCEKKPVQKSVLLDDMSGLEHWETVGPYARIALSDRRREGGLCRHSVQFTSPCRIEHWEGSFGRIYTVPAVLRRVDHENWEHVNRISFWVCPDMPGYRSICLRMQLHNGGSHPVPDKYDREGHHNAALKNGVWQRVSVEIPYLCRDDVTGLSFEYDMCGNEPSATDTACWYITDIELETLEEADLDVYHGWQPARGRIAFSGSGYQIGSRKTAVVNEPEAVSFRVVEAATGKVALEKAIDRVDTSIGSFQVLDFSEICKPGEYLLLCGSIVSRTFPIGADIWEDSVWKALNFLFCQRCGYEVPGKHMACHRDLTATHNGKSIVVNGGWHDAADMAQNLTATSQTTYALFELLARVKHNGALYERVLEEAKWGLDWMLKTRFGDGYRAFSGGTSCWTGSILGDGDDVWAEAENKPIENFMSAGAEAAASIALRESDPILADYALKCAREDFTFAWEARDTEGYDGTGDPARVSSRLLLYTSGILAAVEVFDATGDGYYREMAGEMAEYVMNCQQRETPDWEIPFSGFFYTDDTRREIQHYSHRCHECEPVMALIKLCERFPEDGRFARWHYAVELYAGYIRKAYKYTAPYYMSVASIYHEGEAELMREHPGAVMAEAGEEIFSNYADQVREGVPLGRGYYLRRFPIWFAFRGNNALTLSGGKAAALTGRYTGNYALLELAQRQMEWIVGKNPFAESVMYGEGYDYCQQYTVLPGEMVGEMSVGIESMDNEDAPFWPQVDTCVYKEVWIHVVLRWLWLAADACGPARVKGKLLPGGGEIRFCNKMLDKEYSFTPCGETGFFRAELPAGEYTVFYGGMEKRMTLSAAKEYRLDAPLADFRAEAERKGERVTITLRTFGEGAAEIALRTENLELETEKKTVRLGDAVTFEGTVLEKGRPCLAVLIPDGRLEEKAVVFLE